MVERCLTFDCQGETLVGILHEPTRPAGELGVVVVVGGPQYRVGSHRQFVLMARRLADAGFPVYRFDYRGMGDSSGVHRSFVGVNDDVRLAVDTLCAAQPTVRKVVLFGLCDAASAILLYCGSDPRISSLVLVNPWVRTEQGQAKTYFRHYYIRRFLQVDFWRRLIGGEFKAGVAARSFTENLRRALSGRMRTTVPSTLGTGEGFVDRMRLGLDGFGGPVLFLMSDRDLTAREFEDLCRTDGSWRKLAARQHVRWRTVADADHTFSTSGSLNRATSMMLEWIVDGHQT